MGLMQVTPAAGQYIAKKFGAAYDEKRLLSDQIYNVQFGAAELGDLIEDYRGSYILTFVGYNAGRGRVKEWIARYRRSARSQGRSDRLGRAHSVLGDPQLRAARAGEPAGLPRALRRRLEASDRGRPAPRGGAATSAVIRMSSRVAPTASQAGDFLRTQNWYMPANAAGFSASKSCHKPRSRVGIGLRETARWNGG